MTERLVRVAGAHSSPFTGAAVVHHEIARRLPAHLAGGIRCESVQTATDRIARRARGDRALPRAAVLVQTSTPLPLSARAESIIPVVYDVRWRWTRGRTARWYRQADLIQTARRASHMLTISHAVADQLYALRCVPTGGLTVLQLGPGQFQDVQPAHIDDRPPSVLLVGAAPHKRNELAATLLAQIPAVRNDYRVIGVSVSERTKQLLRGAFDSTQLAFYDGLGTAELAAVYASARSYLALGHSEGFGFPYIEAAHQGCDVIAIEQSVTIEVLGEDAVLLPGTTPSPTDIEDALTSWDRVRVLRLQERSAMRDWNATAAQTATVVARALT